MRLSSAIGTPIIWAIKACLARRQAECHRRPSLNAWLYCGRLFYHSFSMPKPPRIPLSSLSSPISPTLNPIRYLRIHSRLLLPLPPFSTATVRSPLVLFPYHLYCYALFVWHPLPVSVSWVIYVASSSFCLPTAKASTRLNIETVL